MKTLHLTAKDFKKSTSYWSDYIGETDVSDFDGNVEIGSNLGYCRFEKIKTKGYLHAEAGSGIKAGWGIEAGSGIKAGWGIEAGSGIKAGLGIEAGSGIKAGEGIEAGSGIKAGEGIKAGLGIKAGEGIEAGLGIFAKFTISCSLRLFAGLCIWRKPTEDEIKITCSKLLQGEVCYGKLVETGEEETPDENIGKEVKVIIGDKEYKAFIQ